MKRKADWNTAEAHQLKAIGRFFAERLSCPEYTASAGWLSRLKSRHGISLRLLHGEAASVDTGAVSAAHVELQEFISAFA